MQLISPEIQTSNPFTIPSGGQVTLFAHGLQGADKVVVEVVSITKISGGGSLCCPEPVSLPEVVNAIPLQLTCSCETGPVQLTAEKPWVVFDTPQMVSLRARVIADDTAVISVEMFETKSAGVLF